MNPDFENEWERELDARLKNLPEMQAPASLLNSVMNEIEKRSQLVWYQRPYYSWPKPMKVCAGVFLAMIGVMVLVGFNLGASTIPVSSLFSEIGIGMDKTLEVIGGIRNGLAAIGRTALGQYVLGLLVLASVVYGAVFGLGTIVFKMARQQARGNYAA